MILHHEAIDDLAALPGPVRELTVLALHALVHREEHGVRLRHEPLTDCYKLYLDPAVQWRAVFRVTTARARYRARPEQTIEVIAIGPRKDAAVYTTAAQRLGRATDLPRSARRALAAELRTTIGDRLGDAVVEAVRNQPGLPRHSPSRRSNP